MNARTLRRLAVLGTITSVASGSAYAADLPLYPVDANCREATDFFFDGSAMPADRRAAFERDCIKRQQDAYDTVKELWPILRAGDQSACLHVVRTSNYIQLEHCVADLYAQERAVESRGNGSFRP